MTDSSQGILTFVARLAISERYPSGSHVRLPLRSRAVIAQTSPIAAPVIQILTPTDARAVRYLQAGDTIDSERRVSAIDQLGEVASKLSGEIDTTLRDTRAMMRRASSAVAQTQTAMALLTPLMEQSLKRVITNLERTDRMLATLEPRLDPLADSVSVALHDTRVVLRHLDTLSANANTVATENRAAIHEAVERLRRSATLMEHFAEQVSRRPTRLLTGVKVPPPDSGTPP